MSPLDDLQQLSPRYLAALSQLDPDSAFFAVNADQQVVFWSEGASRLLGWDHEEVVGKHCSFAIRCLSCAKGCGIREYGKVSVADLTHLDKNGKPQQVTKVAQAVRDEAGRFLGGLEILRPQQQKRRPGCTALQQFHQILTADQSFLDNLANMRFAAHSGVNMLIRGESGTGKELLARAIHQMSPRAKAPFVAINCGTLSREFLASELFGHKRGAFTGAIQDKQGLFAAAEGGTLFLDEVGECPLEVQAMLLRVLEERRYRRLGDTRDLPTNIRILAATHVSLREAVKQGRFREDLMFRLRVVPFFIPPLRERQGDIPLLWHHFTERSAKKFAIEPCQTTDEVMELLINYPWPGNVRELINLSEYCQVTRPGQQLRQADLPPEFREGSQQPQPKTKERATTRGNPRQSLTKQELEQVLAEVAGNTTLAAKELGISRATLWRKRKQWGLV
ncbi:sigma-54 interaction domain-containing protein [Acanthopleuribacter pedis]|uniref:Sigma 54-interacting transcriptional regulator n=1 Tax=Acanthopleuribacter pedis TaxID=442870 RepID=A0A8J7U2N0_9BACT|nr:sigma 54-interacting transcriptional regulator [Acanthopleuribacter pedis]MBO1317894.1 sigma 54-interacting transcriptional regulator [Acanthopleuribacter pedis]